MHLKFIKKIKNKYYNKKKEKKEEEKRYAVLYNNAALLISIWVATIMQSILEHYNNGKKELDRFQIQCQKGTLTKCVNETIDKRLLFTPILKHFS